MSTREYEFFYNFFIELSGIAPQGGSPNMEQLLSLDAKCGLTTLVPPLLCKPI